MILADILFLCILISLFNRGLHAVTRDGMLLSVFGIRLRTSERLRQYTEQREAELCEINTLQAIANDQNLDSDSAQRIIKEFDSRRDSAYEKCEELCEKEIARAERLKRKPLVRILLAISPALTECAVCMSSFWSMLLLCLYFAFGVIAFVPFAPLIVAGLTVSLSNEKSH
jgi:hypothetical protein